MTMPISYWLFGLSGSGKTAIGNALYYELDDSITVDENHLRSIYPADLVLKGSIIARWEQVNGSIPICSFITPFGAQREMIRNRLPDVQLIYVQCPLYVCKARDVKGLYASTEAGLIPDFTRFEEPSDRDDYLVVNTVSMSVDECVRAILDSTKT